MARRAGPSVLGIAVAGVPFALRIHRGSWQFAAILAGVILVGLVISRVGIAFKRGKDGSGDQPAGEVTHDLFALGPFHVQTVREPASSEEQAEQVFQRAPGSKAEEQQESVS
jgi:hypothetical protein